jgi:hypothetical protein
MFCNKIATGVHHVIKNGEKISSFFVAEGEYWEALQSVGELYLNQHDMHYFVSWATGADRVEDDPQVLLISVDGKYGVIRRFSEIRGWNIDASIHQFLSEDQAAYGGYREFKLALDREVSRDPFLAEKLQLPKPRNVLRARIERRPFGQRASIESLDSSIREAYLDPRKAQADDLILAFLARENAWLDVSQQQHLAVEAELQRLLRDGELWRGGPLHLYDTEGLTLSELRARRKRALKNCEKLWSKFPEPFLANGEIDDLELWLRQFEIDEMLELAAVAWYKCPSPAGREKVCAMVADQVLRS